MQNVISIRAAKHKCCSRCQRCTACVTHMYRHEYPYVICTENVSGPEKNVPGPRKNVPGPGKKYSTHTDLLEHVNYGKKKRGLRRS